jgi:hypothetical protein
LQHRLSILILFYPDIKIIPWVCITYLVMRIDIDNISNAAIMNTEQGTDIKKQLGLSALQWSWAIACFFYPYAALEPISTLVMKWTTYVTFSPICCIMP